MKTVPFVIVCILSLSLGLGIGKLVIDNHDLWNEQLNCPSLPPTWHDIVPSLTEIDQALVLLGSPQWIENRNGYVVYRYEHQFDWDWQKVELWVVKNKVQAVLLAEPRTNAWPRTLGEITIRFGRPQRIWWGAGYSKRYLIWANCGISAKALYYYESETTSIDSEKIWVFDVLLFGPMSLPDFESTQWPWPGNDIFTGWSTIKVEAPPDIVDDVPLDPYNWEKLPLPLATSPPNGIGE